MHTHFGLLHAQSSVKQLNSLCASQKGMHKKKKKKTSNMILIAVQNSIYRKTAFNDHFTVFINSSSSPTDVIPSKELYSKVIQSSAVNDGFHRGGGNSPHPFLACEWKCKVWISTLGHELGSPQIQPNTIILTNYLHKFFPQNICKLFDVPGSMPVIVAVTFGDKAQGHITAGALHWCLCTTVSALQPTGRAVPTDMH